MHLELGGKAPFIVYADADLDAAARGAVAGGYINAGQDCTAATRIYVQAPVYERFLGILKGYADSVRVGDPEDPTTDMGSLINDAQVLRVEGFVERARAAGARVISGGARAVVPGLEGGAFYQADRARGCRPGRRVRPAGDLRPGADGAAVRDRGRGRWPRPTTRSTASRARSGPRDVFKSMRAAKTLNFGAVWVNDHLPIASEMPHGGFKQSGYGKDMSGYSFDEYTQVKHVMIELTGDAEKGWHYQIFGDAPEA